MRQTASQLRNHEPVARAALAAVTFVLGLAGMLVLQLHPSQLVNGSVLCGLALAAFLGGVGRPMANWLTGLAGRLRLSYSRILFAVALALSMLAAGLTPLFAQYDRRSYLPILLVWALSLVFCSAAFVGQASWPVDGRGWFRQHRHELMGLGTVLVLALALRLYALGQIPRVINGDEGIVGLSALATDRPPLNNPFAVRENIGSLYLQTINLALQTLGIGPLALRLWPAVFGSLAVLTTYLLGRCLFGIRVGLIAAALLAIAHAHIHFSRTVAVPYTPGTFLVPLELYFFLSGLEGRSALRLALGGVVLGLHFSVYLGAQIIGPFLLAYTLIALWLCRPLIQSAARQVPAFWLSLGIAALPQFGQFWRQPDEFLARMNADGMLQSGWLGDEMAATGQSAPAILAGRVAHAFLSLVYYRAEDFYGAPIPILGPLMAALFLVGLAYALWRTRDQRFLLLNGYFWSVTLAVGLFAIPPSADSYRMLMAIPAAMLLAAIGLDQLCTLATLHEPRREWIGRGAIVAVLAAILQSNARVYFYEFAGRCRYGSDPQTRFASYLGSFLRTLDRETRVVLLSNSVLRYGTHASVDFLSRNLPVINQDTPVGELSAAPNLTVVAIAERTDELRQWATENPGGTLHREYDCDNLMLLAYRLPVDWRPSVPR